MAVCTSLENNENPWQSQFLYGFEGTSGFTELSRHRQTSLTLANIPFIVSSAHFLTGTLERKKESGTTGAAYRRNPAFPWPRCYILPMRGLRQTYNAARTFASQTESYVLSITRCRQRTVLYASRSASFDARTYANPNVRSSSFNDVFSRDRFAPISVFFVTKMIAHCSYIGS